MAALRTDMKTFYIETFGCQMNAHDSEKVMGTLVAEGYSRVATPDDADLVLYNTCSIRDKAEQKVFNKLDQFKKINRGKKIAVLGCVAQQEGEKIFERAPHVDMVCGSASYPKFGQLLVQLENGNKRVTGLSLDTDGELKWVKSAPGRERENPKRQKPQGQSTARNKDGTARSSDEGPVMGLERRGRAGQIDQMSTRKGRS